MSGTRPGKEARTSSDAPFRPIEYARDVLNVLSWRVWFLMASSVAITLLEGLGLVMLVPLLQLAGIDAGDGSIGRVAEVVARAFDFVRLPMTLPLLLAAFLTIVFLQAFLKRSQALHAFRLQQKFVARLRARLYEALLTARWTFFLQRRSSDFMHKITRELENVGGATFNLIDWAGGILLTLVYLAFAFYLAPIVSSAVLVAGAVLSLTLWPFTRRAHERGASLSDAYEALFSGLNEHLQGMKTAKSHGVENRHIKLFLGMTRDVERTQVAVLANQQTSAFWFRVGSMAILVGMIYIAVGVLSLAPAAIAVLLYVFSRLIPRLSAIQSGYEAFMGYIPSYTRTRLLEREAREAAEPIGSAPAPRLEHMMVFDQVCFSFDPPPARPVLETVRIHLRAGATTAIVGPSGSGKSTLADLAAGLLRPTGGHIEVDGSPLTDEQISAWRRHIGYVAQETFIFHDSVQANLLLTRPDASHSDVDEALDLAAAGFLRQLPDGLETVLGDRGLRLSGGERQRLALARALLRRPDLLILDEATSALDAENESRIHEALEGLRGRVTILLIAHRLATVRAADRIYVLEEGKVVEQGSFDELMQHRRGTFRDIARMQGLHPDTASRV